MLTPLLVLLLAAAGPSTPPGGTEENDPDVPAEAAEAPASEPVAGGPPASLWPSARAPLTVAKVDFPKGFGRPRIYLDAGHGAPGNPGNTGVLCEKEEEHTLRVAQELARRLKATRHFQVKLSRTGAKKPTYPERLKDAEKWKAALVLSVHSDARGSATQWQAAPGQWCSRNDAAPGYSVLYADDSGLPLVSRRLGLARALARRLGEAGFFPYGGEDYVGLYAADPEQPGNFVSRHVPGQRIFVLREPSMPSVIIETHHAWDFQESARWKEPRTLEAFSAAVTQGLVDALSTK